MNNNLQMVRRIAEKVARIELSRRAFAGFVYAWSGNGQPREIWLDQDGGWEDVAALAILLRSPDVKVMGVATTPGIADSRTAEIRVKMLLEALGDKETKLVDDLPAKVEILATGPLTRVARLIRSGQAPKAVIWMGGAVGVKGNVKGDAEWNASADVGALRTVLASNVPLTICPLDLTNQFPADASLLPISQYGILAEFCKAYGEKGRFWWDELAAAYLVAPGLFQKQRMKLLATPSGRILEASTGREVEVLKSCHRDSFRALLKQSLSF
jgi:inosine-uridine nucleoside N-ribohydrolase